MQSDRRKIVRRPVRYPARIDFGDGADLLTCILVDASDEGVQVVTIEPIEWPDEIELLLGYGKNGRRRCRVAWRNGRQAGLEFLAKNTPLHLPGQGSEPVTTSPTKPAAQPPQAALHQHGPVQDDTQTVAFDIDTLLPR
jgi:PilZ domain